MLSKADDPCLQCNRRDDLFSHHGSEAGAEMAAEAYITSGVPKDKITVGFPMFGKAFKTSERWMPSIPV
jgi:hypothetical protein